MSRQNDIELIRIKSITERANYNKSAQRKSGFVLTGSTIEQVIPVSDSFILLESGNFNFLLQENNSKIII